MVTKYVWPLVASALVALLGAALMLWPFALHTNTGGWTHATTSGFWSGLGVAAIGLLAFAAWYGALRKELVQRELIAWPSDTKPAQATLAESPSDDLDRLLRPLAESVLRDLTEQLAVKGGRGGGAIR